MANKSKESQFALEH